jgi:hypothetical protein
LIAAGDIAAGAHVRVELNPRKDKLAIRIGTDDSLAPAC